MDKVDTSTEGVKALMDGVTDGPWDWDGLLCIHGGQPPKGALHQYKCRICDVTATDAVTGLLTMAERNANARFIAAARSLVPAMADRIEALEAEVARLRGTLDTSVTAPKGLVEALRSGQQADMDGTMVKVSRQACEEAADLLADLARPAPTLAEALAIVLTDPQVLRWIAEGYDREDAATRGEPDPWNVDDAGDVGDSRAWQAERIECARQGLERARARITGEAKG